MALDLNITKPVIPSGEELKKPEVAMKASQDMADYNFALQSLKHMMDEEQSTRANIEKGSHDALMNTISNMK